jgi:hypothetical protein
VNYILTIEQNTGLAGLLMLIPLSLAGIKPSHTDNQMDSALGTSEPAFHSPKLQYVWNTLTHMNGG